MAQKRLVGEFPSNSWKLHVLNKLIKNLRETGTIDWSPGSGRPRSARSDDNIDAVEELVLSQKSARQKHIKLCERSQMRRVFTNYLCYELSTTTCSWNVSWSVVRRRWLQPIDRPVRLLPDSCCDRSRRRIANADFINFTDEKVFAVASPVNLQNDK